MILLNINNIPFSLSVQEFTTGAIVKFTQLCSKVPPTALLNFACDWLTSIGIERHTLGLVNRPNDIYLSRANQSQAKFKSAVGGNLLQSWVNLTIVHISLC